MRVFIALSLIFLLIRCSQPVEKGPMTWFEALPASYTGVDFRNDIKNTEAFNIFSYRNFYNGGGVAIGDINNDGLPDIYLTGNLGPNRLYLNKGNFQFEEVTEKAGVAGQRAWSTGVVMVDLNHDGWLDIYVCNAGYVSGDDQENELFINNGDLTFTEKAAAYHLNENGYTTHAAFFDYDLDGDPDCYILNNSFMPVNTLNYSNKRELKAADWPVCDFLKGGGGKLLRNDGGNFVDVSEEAGIYSSLIGFGLGVTVGDVNGDGREDVFIGAAEAICDRLYLQTPTGWQEPAQNAFQGESYYETTAAAFFDADGDGDPDLYVGSGGNNRTQGGRYFRDRLYFNDGSGNFTLSRDALPPNGLNTSVVLPHDFDRDGDLDLFVGSRSIPGIYGLPARSYLFENDGKGSFRSIGETRAPALETLGMVTDVQWVDVLGDQRPELVVVGEWMAPVVLAWEDDMLLPAKISLSDFPGWWYAIATDDVDGDGDQDLIMGNRGENFYFSGSQEAPARLWVSDNEGQGQFALQALPAEVQFSCVCDIYCRDLNGDGHKDLVLEGNDAGFSPQFSQLDASFGHVLLSKGDGSYTRLENQESGLSMRGSIRQWAPIRIGKGDYLLTLINQEPVRLFRLRGE